MKIVRATTQHFPALWTLVVALYGHEQEKHPLLAAGMDERGWAFKAHRTMGWLLDGHSAVFLAYVDEMAVGFVQFSASPTVGNENSTIGSSGGFYVLPEWRKKATFPLMREFVRLVRATGTTHVQAVTLTGNDEACKLYEAHGFAPIAVIYQKDMRHVGRVCTKQEVGQDGGGCKEDGAAGSGGLPE